MKQLLFALLVLWALLWCLWPVADCCVYCGKPFGDLRPRVISGRRCHWQCFWDRNPPPPPPPRPGSDEWYRWHYGISREEWHRRYEGV